MLSKLDVTSDYLENENNRGKKTRLSIYYNDIFKSRFSKKTYYIRVFSRWLQTGTYIFYLRIALNVWLMNFDYREKQMFVVFETSWTKGGLERPYRAREKAHERNSFQRFRPLDRVSRKKIVFWLAFENKSYAIIINI